MSSPPAGPNAAQVDTGPSLTGGGRIVALVVAGVTAVVGVAALAAGSAPSSPPLTQRFWSASANGSRQHTLTWTPQNGTWRIVLMNVDGSCGVGADVRVGARMPNLLTIGIAVLGAGVLLLAMCGGAIYVVFARGRR